MFQDAKILQKANEAAQELLEKDPELTEENHAKMKTHLNKYMSEMMLETTL